MSDVEVTQSDDTALSAEPMDDDSDDLDDLLGMLDEEEEVEQKEKVIEAKKKSEYESELFVGGHCKIRVDPQTRAISVADLSTRLRRWTFVSLLNLPLKLNSKCVTSKQFVLIGVLSSKEIKISKNQNKYLMLKLDDFKANVSCFIFNADAISKFCKIQEGTVLVLASPTIMNERNNNSNDRNHNINGPGSFGQRSTNNMNHTISLKIDDFEQVLVVGKSLDFAFCPKLEGYGRIPCRNVINKATHDLCEFHKAQQYKKYASKRNDTNRSSTSRLRQNTKKSLSGPGNGISMVQRRSRQMASRHNGMLDDRQRNGSGGRFAGNSRFPKKRVAVDHKLQRQRNRETLLESKDMMSEGLRRRMNKYGTGGKQQSQIQSDSKRKEMERILKGKTLIPHLGANWGSNKNTAGKGGGGMQIVFEPKAVSLDPPGTGSNQRKQSKVARKRSFNDMMRSGSVDDKENVNPG